MNKSFFILFCVYLICVIPVIIIYIEHGVHELEASKESTGKKAVRTLAEGGFLLGSAIGYIAATIAIVLFRNNPIAYLAILIGTIFIITIYYLRFEGGVLIPFTDVLIQKYTVGIEGLITKVLQQTLVIPIAILLWENCKKKISHVQQPL